MTPLRWKALAGFLLAAGLSASAWVQGATEMPPGTAGMPPGAPGTLNYVEGQANIGNQALDQSSIGSIQLQPGEELSTGTGKAEILLTPGVFLRVGDNSTVRMVSESPMETAVELTKGQAAVEVVAAYKHIELTMNQDGTTTRLLKKGLYEFDADRGQVLVYKGEAQVQVGGRTVKVKGGQELALNQSGRLKTADFDKKAFENSDLIQFSGLRSEYLAEANADAARGYFLGGGWYGPGWYWDSAFWAYTWVPGEDFYYDAFGWGFYSPWWVDDDPFLFAGFFGDFGVGCFGHTHFGRHRLPLTFSSRVGQGATGHLAAQPPAMGNNLGGTGSGFNRSGTMANHGGASAFNSGATSGVTPGGVPAFNRGGTSAVRGGGFAGGGHVGGFSGGGGHVGGGGFGGGGFGGMHR